MVKTISGEVAAHMIVVGSNPALCTYAELMEVADIRGQGFERTSATVALSLIDVGLDITGSSPVFCI